MASSGETQRFHDIDWLRVIAVALLVPFHTGMIFCHWGFHLKNNELSAALTVQNAFLSSWHMPLFFFLSGAGAWHALAFRPSRKFASERALRLFVPFVFGLLAICPPQIYFERLQQGAFSGSFFQFYPTFFNGPYPEGNLSWQHLWFLLYLFLMSTAALPLLAALRRGKGAAIREKFSAMFSGRAAVFALPLPLLAIQCVAGEGWPNGDQNLVGDLDNFFQYFIIFLYGYTLGATAEFRKTVELNRRGAALAGLAFFVAAQIIQFNVDMNLFSENMLAGLGWLALNTAKTWCLLLAVLGYGIKFLSFANKTLKYAAEAALPFYIIHQTVIIFIGYYVVQTGWSVAAKYTLITIASFAGTLIVYDIAVKRWAVTRFLFGMRLNHNGS